MNEMLHHWGLQTETDLQYAAGEAMHHRSGNQGTARWPLTISCNPAAAGMDDPAAGRIRRLVAT